MKSKNTTWECHMSVRVYGGQVLTITDILLFFFAERLTSKKVIVVWKSKHIT